MTPARAQVASCVVFVSEMSRSVDFYREIFDCEVAVQAADAALLLAPGGFQLYLRALNPSAQHSLGGIGAQYLMWASDSQEAPEQYEQALRARNCFVDAYESDGIKFVRGRDPDGIPVVIAHPSPERRPRSTVDPRLYGW